MKNLFRLLLLSSTLFVVSDAYAQIPVGQLPSANTALGYQLPCAPVGGLNGSTKGCTPSQIVSAGGGSSSSSTVNAGTGLSGGGAISTNPTLSVIYGTSSNTAAQGNDSRITGALSSSGGTMSGILNTNGVNNLNVANILVPSTTNIWFGSNSNTQELNQFTTASTTLPEAAKETVVTSNTGSTNPGSAFKVGDFVALNCSSGSASCYGLNTVVQANASFNSLLTGHEIDLNFNAGRTAGSFGSANAAYNLVLAGTTASSSYPATAALWITGAGSNYNTMWYDGVYISPGPTSNGFEDASNSATAFTVAGTHTTGLDTTNATLTLAVNAKAGQFICFNSSTDCLSYTGGMITASNGVGISAATAAFGTNTTQLATTAFVQNAVSGGVGGYLPLTGGTLTGTLFTPTPTTGDNSTKVATTAFVQSALPVFNIKAYGAVCDGTTNDSTAINNAINAAGAAGGGTVFIPASTNGCVGSVSLTAYNNIAIAGANPTSNASGGSKLIAPNATSSAVSVGSVGGFSMSNILLKGYSCTASNLVSTVPPVLLTYDSTTGAPPNDIVFNNVSVECGYDNVKFFDTSLVKWFGGSIRDFTHTGMTISGDTTVAGGGNDLYFYGLILDQDNVSYQNQGTLAAGIYTNQNGGSITIDGADLLHSHVGILIAPGSNNYVIWLYGNHIYADTCDYAGTTVSGATTVTTAGPSGNTTETYVTGAAGIGIDPSGTGVVDGIMISNSWSSSCLHAVDITGSSTTSISGINLVNLQSLNSGGDIIYSTYASNINISNPLFTGASQLSHNTYSGVELNTGTDHVTITGGRIGAPVEGYSASQKFAIEMDPGFSGTLSVDNTDLSGNQTAAVYNGSTSTTSHIANSPGYNPVGGATISVGSSPFTYTAGLTSESVSVTGGTVSAVGLTGVTICTSSPCFVTLAPNQSVQVIYSAVPTMTTNRQ